MRQQSMLSGLGSTRCWRAVWLALLAAGFLFFNPPGRAAAQAPAPEEESKEVVYLTQKEVLDIAFPGADSIETEKKWLSDADRHAIGEMAKQMVTDKRITYYVGKKGGQIMGYMVVDHVIGRALPITHMVVLNTDGTVRDIEIMVYREPQGWEVRFESFLSQFFGKSWNSDFTGVNSISGATLSVRSMTRAAQKAVAAFKVLYLDKQAAK